MAKANTGAVTLLIGTRKGAFVMKSDSARRAWKMSDGIMIGATINDMVMDHRGSRTILMSARTGHLGPTIFRSTDLGKTWKEATKPPAFPKAPEGEKGISVHHNFFVTPAHASEPGVWYVGTSPQGLFRSEDDGASWEPVSGFNDHPRFKEWWNPPDEGPPDGPTLHSVMIDPRDARHMYLCLSGGGVFESRDQGRDWHPLNKGQVSDFMPNPTAEVGHDPHCMKMHPLNPDRLYQQNHCGVYRMDRATAEWINIGKTLPKPYSDHSYPIVLHPRDPDTVWIFPLDGSFPLGRVSPGGKPAAFVSRNGGKNWKKQANGFPKSGGWFSVKRQAMNADNHDPLGLYLGTTSGEVWTSRDEGARWTRLATSLPEIYSVRAA
ncbi:MAG: glycosyl hydrolase [Chloroflexi bacterium]|nr:glycosyl hydrolase [Chloroflexota bacterium]